MANEGRPVLVTGGTGTLGRALVTTLLEDGRAVRVLSRQPRPASAAPAVEWAVGDLLTGEGLAAATDGVGAVVHCASNPRRPAEDVEAAVQLTLAARAAQVPHLVYISIVGIETVPTQYYAAKLRVEELVEDSGIPWTVLRATQFHDFVAFLLDALSRTPVAFVPRGVSDQPVDVHEVAQRLAALSTGAPAGRVEDMGGPQVLTAMELMRTYLAGTGRRRWVWTVPLPGRIRAFRAGGHLTPEHATGRLTFAEWLQGRR
ncbi:SDR family oxidoreductase [Cellulomonas edaphi]|uniref:NAD(P)H-binding protein n=1 Tax=Cellulomonas edaphi TaxID=3053468 RepID=A0ABT7S9H8_9CELL|nr:NAD(P)H-binding protein [Cellulomons edaphi]MDM7831589.1 NAD(P)H-binding protein [Cellulomons edaphi]